MGDLPAIDGPQAVALRRALHRIPEFGFDLPKTAATVADALGAAGLAVTTGVGRSGVVGVLDSGVPGPVVALRADMDALRIDEKTNLPHASAHPGHMHACGHDGHMAMLVAAAAAAARAGLARGRAVFVFQPAEEHGQGAAAMLEDGLIERFGIDCFHALHNMPGLPAGSFATREGFILGAEDNFRIELRGRGGHSSRPDRTEDPIVPGAHLALALQSIVSRHLDPRETAVVSITEIVTDGTRNVLPFTVALDGDVRHASDAVSAAVEARMRSLAAGIAAGFGLSASVSYTRVFAPTENAPGTTRAARAAALRVAGPGGLRETLPETAADDVGRLFRARPGTLSFIGNGTEGAHGAPLHAETYDFNDAIIGAGAGYFLALLDAELGLGAGSVA